MKKLLYLFLLPSILFSQTTPSVTPRVDGEGSLGTETYRWGEGHFDELKVQKSAVDADDVVNLSTAAAILSGSGDFVNSVAGKTGVVTLDADDISATATKLWMTDNEQAYLAELYSLNVKSYGATGDGITDDTAALQAAIDASVISGRALLFPAGNYRTTASLNNFWSVKMLGSGIIVRGSSNYSVTDSGTAVTNLYVDPVSGSDANDGLGASQAFATLQYAVDKLQAVRRPLVGRYKIHGAGGIYNEKVVIPNGLANSHHYLAFSFPDAPGIHCDPESWPEEGAILDGDGLEGTGFDVGLNNRISIEYLLIRNWYDESVSADAQLWNGLHCKADSFLITTGVSAVGNGYSNIHCGQRSRSYIKGGWLKGAKYSVINTNGSMTLGYNGTDSSDWMIIEGSGRGLSTKHAGSTVIDPMLFYDNSTAIWSNKTGNSVDTRGVSFTDNDVVFHLQGGYLSEHQSRPNTYTGNTRIYKRQGFASLDNVTQQAKTGLDLTQVNGPASTGATSSSLILDTEAFIPKGYLVSSGQYLEVEIWGQNNSSGNSYITPALLASIGGNNNLGTYRIEAGAMFKIKVFLWATTSATQVYMWDCVDAVQNSSSTNIGAGNTTIDFDAASYTFRINGYVTDNTIKIYKTRIILWG